MARCYIRNGVWGWSPKEQEKALEAAGWLEEAHIYRDILPPKQAKQPARVRPEWLLERGDLLRAGSGRWEEIGVATMMALATSEADLSSALERAWDRGATVRAADSGLSLPPSAGVAGINEAIRDWQRAKATARTKPGRVAGYIAAAAKKRAITEAAIKKARPLWRDRKPSRPTGEQIARSVGVSVKTLWKEMGKRPSILRKAQSDVTE